MDIHAQTQRYADLFTALAPDNLDDLRAVLSDQVVFVDPFNTLQGKTDFIAIFEHMFEVMTAPKFTILDVATSPKAGYIKWEMTGSLTSRPTFSLHLVGMSELVFDKDGQLILHHDHWDSAHQLLRHIPVAGFFIQKLLRLFALPKNRGNRAE